MYFSSFNNNIRNSQFKVRKGADGIHLFDRKTGINVLLNEYIPPKSSWTNCPRQVSIALTNLCYLEFPHCYAPKKASKLHKNKVKQWLVELDNAGCFGIGFGGGEPTLYPDLVEICQFGQLNTNLAISLTTHGHHLNKSLIYQLKDHINFLRVSMDGIYSTYESIRGKLFDDLKYNLSLLSGNIPFGINYVVNSRTIDDLENAAHLIESFGASELLLLPEEQVGLGRQIDKITLSRLQLWVSQYRGILKLTVSSRYQHEFETANALITENEKTAFAHIDASGILKNTSFDNVGYPIDHLGVIAAFNKLNNYDKEYF